MAGAALVQEHLHQLAPVVLWRGTVCWWWETCASTTGTVTIAGSRIGATRGRGAADPAQVLSLPRVPEESGFAYLT